MALKEPQDRQRVNMVFGWETAEKLRTVAAVIGGFEDYGQVVRYLVNRGLESMAGQLQSYETNQQLRRIMAEQGQGGQELFQFLKDESAKLEKQDR